MKVIYKPLLNNWYVVQGRHQTPISGAFGTRQEAEEWRTYKLGLEHAKLFVHSLYTTTYK